MNDCDAGRSKHDDTLGNCILFGLIIGRGSVPETVVTVPD